MIRAVAARYPGRVQVVDLDRAISPGDRYTPRLGGHLCRFDGVHFTIYCGERLREPVLSAVAAAVRG